MDSRNLKVQDKDLYEIFTEVSDAKKKEDKVSVLKQHASHPAMKHVLVWAFSDRAVSELPEGTPPYNAHDDADGPSQASVTQYLKLFNYFVRSASSQGVQAMKRERMFIEMLEALDSREAALMIAVKDKKLEGYGFKGLTKKLASEAFPELNL